MKKRILSFLLCFIIIFANGNIAANAATGLSGDVNGDKNITAVDADLVYNHCNGGDQLGEEQFSVADVNKDGDITPRDAMMIYDHYNGVIALPEEPEDEGEFLTPVYIGSDWRFEMTLVNDGETTLTLTGFEIRHLNDGVLYGDIFALSGDGLSRLGLETLVFKPGQSTLWNDHYPIVSDFNQTEYHFIFTDSEGNTVKKVFRYKLATEPPENPSFLTPIYRGNDWLFENLLINNGESDLTLIKVEIRHLNDGVLHGGVYSWSGDELSVLGLKDLVLAPNQFFTWSDGHPVVDYFNQSEYRFTFTDIDGNIEEKVFLYKLEMSPPEDVNIGFWEPVYDNWWGFEITLINYIQKDITLTKVEICHLNDGVLYGDVYSWSGDELEELGLGNLTLEPDQSKDWLDTHPMTSDFNQAEYRFFFTDEDGNTFEKVFRYRLRMPPVQEEVFEPDEEKDLETLRHNASFEVEVFDDVYWVPANILGESRYTNAEISAMLSDSPEEKQDAVNTLYEALQLYQIGEFAEGDDNIRIREGNINWEHHKPGYHAVRTNNGCCATDSNWLRYILDGDYDEVGFLQTSQRDGGGHVFNYIKQDGFYYFIDLTHYRTDWMATALENGLLESYYSTDFIGGNIHKTSSVQAYVDYIQEAYGDPPGLVFIYTAENCLAIDGVWKNGGITITYENTVPVKVVFDDPNDSLYYAFVDPPKNYPDWSQIPSYNFP